MFFFKSFVCSPGETAGEVDGVVLKSAGKNLHDMDRLDGKVFPADDAFLMHKA